MADKNGILENIEIDPEIKENIFDELVWWQKGDVVSDYTQQKFGIYMLKYNSKEEMLNKTERITGLFKVCIEETK
jgi:HEPN domain-containing protein